MRMRMGSADSHQLTPFPFPHPHRLFPDLVLRAPRRPANRRRSLEHSLESFLIERPPPVRNWREPALPRGRFEAQPSGPEAPRQIRPVRFLVRPPHFEHRPFESCGVPEGPHHISCRTARVATRSDPSKSRSDATASVRSAARECPTARQRRCFPRR